MFSNILHHNSPIGVKIKTEVFETENEVIQSESDETCEGRTDNTFDENNSNELNYDVKVKSEICKMNDFKSPTEYQNGEIAEIQKVFIKVEDEIDYYVENENDEECMLEERDKQEYFSGINNVEQQEQFCSQNDLFNQNGPGNSTENESPKIYEIGKSLINKNNIEQVLIKVEPDDFPEIDTNVNYFKSPAKYQVDGVSIKDKIEENNLKHEINDEFIIKDEHEDPGIHNVEQIEQFCNQKGPGNSTANKNDSNTADSMCGPYQELLLQRKEMIRCHKCIKTFNSKEDLKIHYRIHTKKSPIKSHECDVCQKVFNRKDILKRHKLTHTGEQPYKCDTCQKTFSQISHLKIHQLVHTGEKPYVCDVCQKAFNRSNNLQRHQLTHSDYKPHECDVCHKTFRLPGDLSKHQLTHSQKKLHVCDVCQKGFSLIGNLHVHKRIHSGEKPYMCDICQQTFSTTKNLKIHQLLHSGEQLHKCDVCQKEFNRKDILRRHKFTHSGEQPYKCDVCQKTFSQIGHLNSHKLVHTGEKPFVCNVCQKAFNRLNNLQRHQVTHSYKKPQVNDSSY